MFYDLIIQKVFPKNSTTYQNFNLKIASFDPIESPALLLPTFTACWWEYAQRHYKGRLCERTQMMTFEQNSIFPGPTKKREENWKQV